MRALSTCMLGAFVSAAQAQGLELGARYWYSESTTMRSHNAQGAAPSLGNPTSVLTYEEIGAHAVELHARKSLPEGGFVKGNAGVGSIRRGSFDDEDFLAGQVKFSDSTSAVKGNRLAYFTLDAGRELWNLGAHTRLGLFAGYHYWVERLDAFGATFTVGGPDSIPESEAVISNEVTWHSLRVGLVADARLAARGRLVMEAALVPYAGVRDEDSHWLRQDPNDLGPAPNIIVEGEGYGFHLELELRYAVAELWELGAGVRHWHLRATEGNRIAAGTSLPLNEIESRRTGLSLSLTRRW